MINGVEKKSINFLFLFKEVEKAKLFFLFFFKLRLHHFLFHAKLLIIDLVYSR